MNSIVHNMDCMIGMAQFPDKYFDLAVVDPPYGIGNFVRSTSRGKKLNRRSVAWNDVIPDENYFTELYRVSHNQIIWGANYYNCFTSGGSIIWYKNMGHPDFSQCEIASNSLKRTVDYFAFDWNVCRHHLEVIIHQCQKPVALYSWIYHTYLPQGGKVLDTHLGSGSNRIAAHKAGNIDFTGYELDKDYYEAAEKRYKQFISQLTIQF